MTAEYRATPALVANVRVLATLANEICGTCVPREYAPHLKVWMDRIQAHARRSSAALSRSRPGRRGIRSRTAPGSRAPSRRRAGRPPRCPDDGARIEILVQSVSIRIREDRADDVLRQGAIVVPVLRHAGVR